MGLSGSPWDNASWAEVAPALGQKGLVAQGHGFDSRKTRTSVLEMTMVFIVISHVFL
jgi:hypothetical protein